MAQFNIVLPKLGESIQEATVTKWFVKEGDTIHEDDILFEVATDKVDSEIPSPVDGTIIKIFHPENTLLPVGEILAIVKLEDEDENPETSDSTSTTSESNIPELTKDRGQKGDSGVDDIRSLSNRFYSPLVKKIAQEENLSVSELENIPGTGDRGRVRKNDILQYLDNRKVVEPKVVAPQAQVLPQPAAQPAKAKVSVSVGAEDQIIEMDRVRKLIAEHMVMSKQVSAHVTSVVEADVTNLVLWRNQYKDEFQKKYGEKITFLPIFTEAVAQALTEFPLLNSSVDGERIIVHRAVNIGIAVAKPDGNLIVPVIKNAEEKNLVGITKSLNKLAEAARNNKLSLEDIQDGTFTITNFGSFRNLIGTPIINQPQVAILATGNIEKKPAVMELPTGDAIVIRHKMFLSLSYDHRIIDGALGGAFLRRIADILEEFDINRTF